VSKPPLSVHSSTLKLKPSIQWSCDMVRAYHVGAPPYIPHVMSAKTTLDGRELSQDDLERIRAEIEAYDSIDHVSDELRDLIASQWPHLLAKLGPARLN
jgi:hypothetical protein